MKRVGIAMVIAGAGLFAGILLGGCTHSETGVPENTTSIPTTTIVQTTTSDRPSTTVQPTTTVRPATSLAPTTTIRPASPTFLPGTEYSRLPTEDKVVALTFDASYDPAPLESILGTLAEAKADATFFLTGEFVSSFPQWTKRIIDAGHPIGNHSYSHPDFTKLSDEAMRTEIDKTASALLKLGAADPGPLFRAPYGARNQRVLSLLRSEGYASVYWTIDTIDWRPERTPAQIKATVLDKLQPGAIILMHVGSRQTAQVLPELLKEIRMRGYDFVSLREALPSAAE